MGSYGLQLGVVPLPSTKVIPFTFNFGLLLGKGDISPLAWNQEVVWNNNKSERPPPQKKPFLKPEKTINKWLVHVDFNIFTREKVLGTHHFNPFKAGCGWSFGRFSFNVAQRLIHKMETKH